MSEIGTIIRRIVRLMGPIGPIILLGLLAACTAEAPVPTGGQGLRPVAIGDGYTLQPTRSSQAFTANRGIPAGGSIGIYAYYHDNCTWSTSTPTPDFMWNQQATRLDDDNSFTYSPLKYWPNEESDKLSFIAYFPYTPFEGAPADPAIPADPTTATGLKTLMDNSDTGLPTFRFAVKDNSDEQIDFLVSRLITDLPESRDTEGDPGQPFNNLSITDRVHFLFFHMTTKVEFRLVVDPSIRKDIAHFQINTLSISNIYSEGKLTPAYSPLTATTFAWSDYTRLHNYDCTTYEPLLLLPQTLRNDAIITASYDMTFKSSNTSYHYSGDTPVADETYTYRNTASLPLNTMKQTTTGEPLKAWLANHHYVYTIRLRANRIDFTGEVVDWGDTDTMPNIEIEEE